MSQTPLFAGFELRGELGRGAFGRVMLARDPRTEREVAIKILSGGLRDPDGWERFSREAQLTAALNHPGIVRVHTSGVEGREPYVVYECVEGARPFDEAATTLPPLERVRLVRDAAAALGYAHGKGVVHRDVKPENLLVDLSGRVRVVDFGIALALDLERLTQTGALVGTPYFMSPEQLQGRRDGVGPAADVWALGILLHWSLCGSYPFQGPTLFELMAQISELQPSLRLPAGVPAGVGAVARRALAKDSARRYPDGAAFAQALDAALDGRWPGWVTRLGVGALAASLAIALTLWAQSSPPGSGSARPLQPARAPVASPTPLSSPSRVSTTPRSEPDDLEWSRGVAGRSPRLSEELLASSPYLRELHDGACAGEVTAMMNLGAWLFGLVARKADPELERQAVYWLRRAADQGDAKAIVKLVSYHSDTESPGRDAAERIRWLERGVELRIGDCLKRLGRDLLDQDPARAVQLFEQGAAADDAGCYAELARLLFAGDHGVKPDRERALALWRRGVAQKDTGCMIALGEALCDPARSSAEHEEGLSLLTGAVDQGSLGATVELARRLRDGVVVAPDRARARTLLEAAAARGSVEAELELVPLLRSGDGGAPDTARAWRYLLRVEGQVRSSLLERVYAYQAEMLRDAEGVERDVLAARDKFVAAVGRGYDPALVPLARLLLGGPPGVRDRAAGAKLFADALASDYQPRWRLLRAFGAALADPEGPWDAAQVAALRAALTRARDEGDETARRELKRLE